MKDIAILIPTLNRTYQIKPLLDSIYRNTPNPRPVFICTEGHNEVINLLRECGEEHYVVPYCAKGDYAKKINYGFTMTDEPLIFTAATDLNFHSAWFDNAIAHLNDQIHVVGTNDLGNESVLRGVHSTHTLITREYVDKYGTIDEPGKVLHEGYWHEFVDDELVETAKARDTFAMALNSIVEHMHPTFGKGRWDDSYHQLWERMDQGHAVYDSRRHLWM